MAMMTPDATAKAYMCHTLHTPVRMSTPMHSETRHTPSREL